jgi:hypothetical protein
MDLTPLKRMFVPACFFFGFLFLGLALFEPGTGRDFGPVGFVLIGLGFGGTYFKLEQVFLLIQQGKLK